MSKIEELADRVERLLLRHEELRRTNGLLEEQLAAVAQERDQLRSRLNAAGDAILFSRSVGMTPPPVEDRISNVQRVPLATGVVATVTASPYVPVLPTTAPAPVLAL